MKAKKAAARKTTKTAAKKAPTEKPRCGLCGATRRLTKTECCDQWICDDEDKYVLFSYARNSCSRNHRRYTLCSFHFGEGHSGSWQSCEKCRKEFDTPTYVYFATNEHNFVKLDNPPAFDPVRCSKCQAEINIATDGYVMGRDGYKCMKCGALELQDRLV